MEWRSLPQPTAIKNMLMKVVYWFSRMKPLWQQGWRGLRSSTGDGNKKAEALDGIRSHSKEAISSNMDKWEAGIGEMGCWEGGTVAEP